MAIAAFYDVGKEEIRELTALEFWAIEDDLAFVLVSTSTWVQ